MSLSFLYIDTIRGRRKVFVFASASYSTSTVYSKYKFLQISFLQGEFKSKAEQAVQAGEQFCELYYDIFDNKRHVSSALQLYLYLYQLASYLTSHIN